MSRITLAVIRHKVINDEVGMVITTSTPTDFTARFKLYALRDDNKLHYITTGLTCMSEKGAIQHFNMWVKTNEARET